MNQKDSENELIDTELEVLNNTLFLITDVLYSFCMSIRPDMQLDEFIHYINKYLTFKKINNQFYMIVVPINTNDKKDVRIDAANIEEIVIHHMKPVNDTIGDTISSPVHSINGGMRVANYAKDCGVYGINKTMKLLIDMHKAYRPSLDDYALIKEFMNNCLVDLEDKKDSFMFSIINTDYIDYEETIMFENIKHIMNKVLAFIMNIMVSSQYRDNMYDFDGRLKFDKYDELSISLLLNDITSILSNMYTSLIHYNDTGEDFSRFPLIKGTMKYRKVGDGYIDVIDNPPRYDIKTYFVDYHILQ